MLLHILIGGNVKSKNVVNSDYKLSNFIIVYVYIK